jgi:hypothetical protein
MDWSENIKNGADEKERFRIRSLCNIWGLRRPACCYHNSGWRMCGIGVVVALWRGVGLVGAWFGRSWTPGDEARRLCLAVMLSIYFLRLLLTQFVFLKRAVGWGEAFMIVPWVLCIYLLLAIVGGRNSAPFGAVAGVGAGLFVF